VLARRYDHAVPGAGVDIDVRVHAALADQLQFVQAGEKRGANLSPLAYQYEGFGFFQPLGERIELLSVVIPNCDVMACQLLEAGKRAQSIEIVVQY
jgi:hypothetical protein